MGKRTKGRARRVAGGSKAVRAAGLAVALSTLSSACAPTLSKSPTDVSQARRSKTPERAPEAHVPSLEQHASAFADELSVCLNDATPSRVAALVGSPRALPETAVGNDFSTLIHQASAEPGETVNVVRVTATGECEAKVVTRHDRSDGTHLFLGWLVTLNDDGRPQLQDLLDYTQGVSAGGLEVASVNAALSYDDILDMENAFRELRALEREIGPDPVLDLLRAEVALHADRLDEARTYANRARQAMPASHQAHWALVTISVAQRNYDDAVGYLRTLRDALHADGTELSLDSAAWLGPNTKTLLKSEGYKKFAAETKHAAR